MSRSPSVAVRAAAYPTRAEAPLGEGVATQAPAAPADERRDAPSSLSCVIPCRNEAANLALLLPRLRAVLGQLSPEWEIVLVDDGSVDDTAMQLADWTAESGVRVLQLSRNFGKEAALSAGLAA
ncbi:MAG: glycosyltransferase, partial [Burkholderiaceae bacterium]